MIGDQPQDVPGSSIDVETDGEVAQGEIHDKVGVSIRCQARARTGEKKKEETFIGHLPCVSTLFVFSLVLLTYSVSTRGRCLGDEAMQWLHR